MWECVCGRKGDRETESGREQVERELVFSIISLFPSLYDEDREQAESVIGNASARATRGAINEEICASQQSVTGGVGGGRGSLEQPKREEGVYSEGGGFCAAAGEGGGRRG